jgi:hypothetical protein
VGEKWRFLGLIIQPYRNGRGDPGGIELMTCESGEVLLEDFNDDSDIATHRKPVLSHVLTFAKR